MKCECLFCTSTAVARLTVPHHKPRTWVCEADLARQLKWAEPWRRVLGAIIVESAA